MTPVMGQQKAVPANTNVDRRATRRRRVLKGATLSFNRGYSAFECVVRSQSDGGARLSLGETFAIPATFRLAIAGEADARTVHIVWRKPDELGVTFE